MKMHKASCTLLIGIIALVLGCERRETIVWNDLTKTNKTEFNCNLKCVSMLNVHVKGMVDGTGRLLTPDNRSILLSGIININYGMDYFQTNCTLIYEPVTSKSGHLKLVVTFSRF